jgi:hypothetical protein
MDPILITYGQMHPFNNACQELLKLIGLAITNIFCIQIPRLCLTVPPHR